MDEQVLIVDYDDDLMAVVNRFIRVMKRFGLKVVDESPEGEDFLKYRISKADELPL